MKGFFLMISCNPPNHKDILKLVCMVGKINGFLLDDNVKSFYAVSVCLNQTLEYLQQKEKEVKSTNKQTLELEDCGKSNCMVALTNLSAATILVGTPMSKATATSLHWQLEYLDIGTH
jgi:hypothetical protein